MYSVSSKLLVYRALVAFLEPETDEAAIRAWLPQPEEPVRIATYEASYEIYLHGKAHPSLLCAALYGRVGEWKEAAAVAKGVLAVALNPLVRVEANRLLGECHAALGERAAGRWCRGSGRGHRPPHGASCGDG